MQDRIEDREYTKQFNFNLWKALLKEAAPHWKLMILLGVVLLIAAGIDVVIPLFTRYAIDTYIVPGKTAGLSRFAYAYAALILVQTFQTFSLIALAGKIETGMNFNLRKKCYKRLQEMEFGYYDKTPTGWIVARLTTDISRLGSVVAWGIVDILWGLILMVGMAAVMFVLDFRLALIALSCVPVLIIVSKYFHIAILKSYRHVRQFNSQITNSYGECVHGSKTSKTLVREEANNHEFAALSNQMYVHSVRAAIKSALYMPVILVIASVSTGLVIWLGGNRVISQTMGYGTFIAFFSYTLAFFEPVSHISRLFSELQNAQAASERVFSLLQLKPAITDTVPFSAEWQQRKMAAAIDVADLSFAYKEGKPVFSGFSLSINAGESIALVGETGTGKTTLVNLICRFYEPQAGSIIIDGDDYRNVPQEWIHSHLGYVQQVPHLFQGTIKENIRYGKLDASEDEIIEAAKTVFAHDFIVNYSDGYEYKVGESGSLLSTGQKQLISFARVVLSNPSLLILDEATSSIDTETEQLVQKAIYRILQGRTSIVIAHRLSTVRYLDRIIFMHKGKIVEEGNHQQLMRCKGEYYELYLNQFISEAGDKVLSGK